MSRTLFTNFFAKWNEHQGYSKILFLKFFDDLTLDILIKNALYKVFREVSFIYYVREWNKWVGVISKILDFCQNDLFWPIKGGRDHFENGIFQKYSTRLPHIVYDPSLIAKTINRIRLDKRIWRIQLLPFYFVVYFGLYPITQLTTTSHSFIEVYARERS